MVVRWACLLLPEVLVRIQFVTTTKPLIIEYLGTPAVKIKKILEARFGTLLREGRLASRAFRDEAFWRGGPTGGRSLRVNLLLEKLA
ncbi:hypothetical protein Tco_1433402 [Tanacetum coccineum]